MRIAHTATALALLLVGCGPPPVIGSGHVVRQTRAVGPFTRIACDGNAQVLLTPGPSAPLEISGDDNLLDHLETSTENGLLRIRFPANYQTKSPLVIKAATPTVEGLALSGVVTLTAHGLQSPTLKVDLAGACTAELAGSTDTLTATAVGSCNLQAANLSAQHVKAALFGASTAEVCATQILDATVSGAGTLRYTGHPAQIQRSLSGAGKIEAGD